MDTQAKEIQATQAWLDQLVIGLNLCPFARSVRDTHGIRYTLSNARSHDTLLADLVAEFDWLQTHPEVETSLLIHPWILQDFYHYNDFLAVTDALLMDLSLEGVFQIASFHPQYQFADTQPDDITNFTNRAPYPTLHVLRESSVAQALEHYPNPEQIPQRNMQRLLALGRDEIVSRMTRITG